jgi:hypothetical protein
MKVLPKWTEPAFSRAHCEPARPPLRAARVCASRMCLCQAFPPIAPRQPSRRCFACRPPANLDGPAKLPSHRDAQRTSSRFARYSSRQNREPSAASSSYDGIMDPQYAAPSRAGRHRVVRWLSWSPRVGRAEMDFKVIQRFVGPIFQQAGQSSVARVGRIEWWSRHLLVQELADQLVSATRCPSQSSTGSLPLGASRPACRTCMPL